jgi:hypothetical protein
LDFDLVEELTQRNTGGNTELHRERNEGEKRRMGEKQINGKENSVLLSETPCNSVVWISIWRKRKKIEL